MFCTHCGQKNEDTARFCQHCGQPMASRPSDAPTPSPAFVKECPVMSVSSVGTLVKSSFSSPLFLVSAIFFSIYLFFGLVTSVMGSGMMYAYVSVGDAYVGGYLFGSLLGLAPVVLIVIGLWLLYASAVDRSVTSVRTSGLTLVKVAAIICLVLFAVVAGILLIGAIAATTDPKIKADGDTPYVIIAVVLVDAIMALFIVFMTKLARTATVIRHTVKTDTVTVDISAFVPVMMFVFAGFCAINALQTLISHADFLGFLFTGTLAGALICSGIFLFQYKGAVKKELAAQHVDLT